MNLFDIVKRRDRSLVVESGSIENAHRGGSNGFLGVCLAPRTVVRLSRASEFACLSTFPREIGWHLRGPSFRVTLTACDGNQRAVLFASESDVPTRVILDWPAWTSDGFDLKIANPADEPLEIESSPFFNSRTAIAPLISGKGIEVGPGSNPFVKSNEQTEVVYLEAYSAEDWQKMYHKEGQTLDWSKYALGDAHNLDDFKDKSLDFIFSSHVFEHLMNPLGVLENWARTLKSGGIVAGVVPDLRYCFDLRQPASTLDEWKLEYQNSSWKPSLSKYEKWCRYTAPTANPTDLIARNYSIHTHYYTPDTFKILAQAAMARGLFRKVFFTTSPNNKDFGFVVWR